MRQTGNSTVLPWLRDAYATESQSVQMLTSRPPSLTVFPEFHENIGMHADLSREQRDRLGPPSPSWARPHHCSGMASGLTAPMMIAALPDSVARSAIANYTFEHLEIGTYRALIGLAEPTGDRETRSQAESAPAQELEMVTWLEEHLIAIAAEVLAWAELLHGSMQPSGETIPLPDL